VPVKICLTDLGVRNALFRGAPSLWESAPDVVGPLVETLAQSVLRGPGIQVHFYRDFSTPGNRRSPLEEVDFVVEALDGTTLPVEIKFRRSIQPSDVKAVRSFRQRFKAPWGLVVTRDHFEPRAEGEITHVPVLDFLLAF
jgi:predicted AAA+ superfamily ATPase